MRDMLLWLWGPSFPKVDRESVTWNSVAFLLGMPAGVAVYRPWVKRHDRKVLEDHERGE
jgi:hypothetical protein